MFDYDPAASPLRRKDCRHGSFTYYAADNPIGQSMAEYGEWAEAEVALFTRFVRPGDVVVEAGSNIGIHTLALARMVGPAGLVYAFEPMGCNNQLLNANIIANGLTNIRSYQMGCGETNEILPFPQAWPDHQNNFGAFGLYTPVFFPGMATVPCAVISIDSLALPRIDLIKIDVEGHEREVVLGAMGAIAAHRPAMLIETLNQFSMSESKEGHLHWIIDRLQPLGYDFFHYITPLFNNQNWRANPADLFPNQWSWDVLCLPTERFAVTGLEDANAGPPTRFDPEAWRSVVINRTA